VQPIEGIQRTETFISLEESMKRPIQILRDDSVLEQEKKR
jgi:hypothetical protein